MIEVVEKINNILQVIYTFIPKDLVIILMAVLIIVIFVLLREGFKKWISQGSKRN